LWADGSGGFRFGDGGLAVADGDLLAGDGLELVGQSAGPALFVDPGVEVVGAEVAEPDGTVGQQVVDDDQDCVAGGYGRLLFAAAFGDASVPCAEEGGSTGCRCGVGCPTSGCTI
jgi:hypothetical protein